MVLESENEILKKFNKEDYILTFSVEGVNVFVTDIHKDVYVDLEVLFSLRRILRGLKRNGRPAVECA